MKEKRLMNRAKLYPNCDDEIRKIFVNRHKCCNVRRPGYYVNSSWIYNKLNIILTPLDLGQDFYICHNMLLLINIRNDINASNHPILLPSETTATQTLTEITPDKLTEKIKKDTTLTMMQQPKKETKRKLSGTVMVSPIKRRRSERLVTRSTKINKNTTSSKIICKNEPIYISYQMNELKIISSKRHRYGKLKSHTPNMNNDTISSNILTVHPINIPNNMNNRIQNTPNDLVLTSATKKCTNTTIELLMDDIEDVLQLHLRNYKKQYRDKKKKKRFNLKWSFQLGYTTNARGANGFPIEHNFKPNKGVCLTPIDKRRWSKWKIELWNLCKQIMMMIDPDYVEGEYVVNFSCMDKKSHYVRKHIDKDDISYQYAMALGTFENAYLQVYDSNNQIIGKYDYNRRLLKMDGRLPHEVLMDGFKGTRFCVIWFKLYDHRKIEEDKVLTQPVYEY